MQLVIRVDLEKAEQPLPEIFKLIGSGAWTEDGMEDPVVGAAGRIEGDSSRAIGEWEIEENCETADRPNPLEFAYRAAATARYALPGQIEVDRFATVSAANDGAYVQGWLFVPREEVAPRNESLPPAKPPRAVSQIRSQGTKAG